MEKSELAPQWRRRAEKLNSSDPEVVAWQLGVERRKNEQKKAKRAAETPEQREERLAKRRRQEAERRVQPCQQQQQQDTVGDVKARREESAADRGAGDAASAESHVSVGTAPGTSGLREPRQAMRSRRSEQRADDLLSSFAGNYAESVALAQQPNNKIQDLLQSVQQLRMAVENQGAATLRQAVATERLASAAEQQVQQNTQLLQELRSLTRMAPALLLCIQQAMGMPPEAPADGPPS
nr:troponin I-like [Dermacentor andersoni]